MQDAGIEKRTKSIRRWKQALLWVQCSPFVLPRIHMCVRPTNKRIIHKGNNLTTRTGPKFHGRTRKFVPLCQANKDEKDPERKATETPDDKD